MFKFFSKSKDSFNIEKDSKIEIIKESLSPFENLLFWIFLIIIAISSYSLISKVSASLTVTVPKYGGSISEGIVGLPRFINPVLAVTDEDRDMTELIYSGLLKYVPGKGLVEDLASGYTISEDSTVYTFLLKDNIYFQDGTPITTDDIVFTIEKAIDPVIKSPKRANWFNVKVEKISPKIIRFTLTKPYAPFIENATMGILPKHIWENVDAERFTFSQYNIEPIGSGPYMIDTLNRTSGGIPEYYQLKAFNNYALGEPYVKDITIYMYSNFEKAYSALKGGQIDNLATIPPESADEIIKNSKDIKILKQSLPIQYSLFFNQNQAQIFVFKEVRQALSLATDRKEIIDNVISGYAVAICSPIVGNNCSDENVTNIDEAKKLLEKNGWKLNSSGVYEKKDSKDKKKIYTLEFSITTANFPEMKQTANILKQQFEKIGAKVDVKLFDYGDLNQTVLKGRKYDSLLYGQTVIRGSGLYAFWHSSQKDYPGANVATYTSIKADKALEKILAENDPVILNDLYAQLEKEIADDLPAIFLYSPDFIYAINKDIQNINLEGINTPSERFSGISKWFTDTENIWPVMEKI